MNYIACVILLGLIILSQEFSPEQHKTIDDIIGKCAAESDMPIDSDLILLYKYNGTLFPDDENSKKFVTCGLVFIDALKDDKIQRQQYIDFFSENNDVQALTEATEKCADVDGDTTIEIGYNFFKCFWNEKGFEF
ncbi:uncharacterized protein LOC131428430 [Malaya genurostris]|uniref:uncharacterized protein LOC131428430 n=1 Tax=Malaya genurostris TaxID=325434 RepID=UPI0026F3AC66|nr:uncharacterized protein LOC131428430 [Malaya genurostris]